MFISDNAIFCEKQLSVFAPPPPKKKLNHMYDKSYLYYTGVPAHCILFYR